MSRVRSLLSRLKQKLRTLQINPIEDKRIGSMNPLSPYLIVFLGAGLGGALRHGVNVAALRLLGSGFPYGTLAVNISGSFVMGVLIGWFTHKSDPGQTWRLFLTTGILGGFTMFSSFSLDTVLLWEQGTLWRPGAYIIASVVLSILGTLSGLALIRAIN